MSAVVNVSYLYFTPWLKQKELLFHTKQHKKSVVLFVDAVVVTTAVASGLLQFEDYKKECKRVWTYIVISYEEIRYLTFPTGMYLFII